MTYEETTGTPVTRTWFEATERIGPIQVTEHASIEDGGNELRFTIPVSQEDKETFTKLIDVDDADVYVMFLVAKKQTVTENVERFTKTECVQRAAELAEREGNVYTAMMLRDMDAWDECGCDRVNVPCGVHGKAQHVAEEVLTVTPVTVGPTVRQVHAFLHGLGWVPGSPGVSGSMWTFNGVRLAVPHDVGSVNQGEPVAVDLSTLDFLSRRLADIHKLNVNEIKKDMVLTVAPDSPLVTPPITIT